MLNPQAEAHPARLAICMTIANDGRFSGVTGPAQEHRDGCVAMSHIKIFRRQDHTPGFPKDFNDRASEDERDKAEDCSLKLTENKMRCIINATHVC